jgi:predicted RNA-binding protein
MEYPKFQNRDYIGLNGTTIDQLTHPHFNKWHDWFIEEYKPEKKDIALFLPCAAIKPYYNSPIHKEINNILKKHEKYIHKIVISNAGIIPYEFSVKYPFNSYDWNPLAESEDIQSKYFKITKDRILRFLKRHKYKNYISYLRNNSISYKSLDEACEQLNIDLVTSSLNETISSNKDTDLVLTYPENLKKLDIMLGEIK